MTAPSRPIRSRIACVAALLLVLGSALMPRTAFAAAPIVIDGKFEDWEGRAYLDDPYGDTKHHWDDVRYWYWGTNDGVSSIYFMVHRYEHHGQDLDESQDNSQNQSDDESYSIPAISGISEGKGNKDKKQVHYTIFVDLDNDGRFSEAHDAAIYADYYPKYDGLTLVSVFSPGGQQFYSGMWGDSDQEGGRRCEWQVPFSYLGIQPGQAIRMVLFAQDKRTDWLRPDPISEYEDLVRRREADRVPDRGDLQWSPISTLGEYGWVALVGAGVVIPLVLKRRKRNLG